jgi:3-hydroxymyristoyl/3-hydroxydecanoyl-(acyl carrier protein) dehydratase
MGNTTTRVIPIQHPAFDGHFPGAPLLPGVVLLDEMLRVVEGDRPQAPGSPLGADGGWTLSSAKFLHPVRPGETLTFEHETLANGSIRFSIRNADAESTLVASGMLVPRLPTEEPPRENRE